MTRIGFVKRVILARQTKLWQISLAILSCILLPTLFRLSINVFMDGRLPYVTYFPFVLLSAVFIGARAAVVVALVSDAISNALFILYPSPFWNVRHIAGGAVLFLMASALLILIGETLRRTVFELEATAQREQMLAAELAHRNKNHLMLIGALARQSRQAGRSPEDFYDALLPRIQALADAQDLLTTHGWTSGEIRSLVEKALAPFSHHPGIEIDGPKARLSSATCLPLVMVLHELATNASKYGALSVPNGQVWVRWHVTRDHPNGILEWTEYDGPPVVTPSRRGLGTTLITGDSAFEAVDLAFRPEGVHCIVRLRDMEVLAPASPGPGPSTSGPLGRTER